MQSCRLLGVKVGGHTVFCSAQSKYNSCMLKYSKIDFTCDCVANITEWTGGLHASVDCKITAESLPCVVSANDWGEPERAPH